MRCPKRCCGRAKRKCINPASQAQICGHWASLHYKFDDVAKVQIQRDRGIKRFDCLLSNFNKCVHLLNQLGRPKRNPLQPKSGCENAASWGTPRDKTWLRKKAPQPSTSLRLSRRLLRASPSFPHTIPAVRTIEGSKSGLRQHLDVKNAWSNTFFVSVSAHQAKAEKLSGRP